MHLRKKISFFSWLQENHQEGVFVIADGAAFGAARLARLACTGEPVRDICGKPAGEARRFDPDPEYVSAYDRHYLIWQQAARDSQGLR